MGRLKTGTPPRLKADTIDYSRCGVQAGDNPPQPFSFMNDSVWINVCRTYIFRFLGYISTKMKLSSYHFVQLSLKKNGSVKNFVHLV